MAPPTGPLWDPYETPVGPFHIWQGSFGVREDDFFDAVSKYARGPHLTLRDPT